MTRNVGILWVQEAIKNGVKPFSSEILVRDQDVIHTFRNAKIHQLPINWYKQLPIHIQNPQAVVLDTTHAQPAMLFVFDVGNQAKKLVLELNYQVRKTGIRNVLNTGRIINSTAIKDQIGYEYSLIDGKL